jgi:hypothetical protein
MPTTFEELVRQYADQKQSAAENPVDWDEQKKWWQERVSLLFSEISGWLNPLISSNIVTFSKANISLTEELLGQYEIESCTIRLKQQTLRFIPKASMIIGGFGRIDVDGPNGSAMLVLYTQDDTIPRDKRRDRAEWFISHPQHRTTLRPLTKAAFEQLFTDLFGIVE